MIKNTINGGYSYKNSLQDEMHNGYDYTLRTCFGQSVTSCSN